MATSLPLALKAGSSNFVGHALVNVQRATSVWFARSKTTIAPCLRTTWPSTTCCRQSHSSVESVIPPFKVTSENLVKPGSLCTVVLSPPSRVSITSVVEPRPVQSVKLAWEMPSISTRKLKLRMKSTRRSVCGHANS